MTGEEPRGRRPALVVAPAVTTLGSNEMCAALCEAQSLFVLTGSGISAESGLPTFRGVGGLWRTHRVEELASPEGFARDPVLVWRWYNERKAAHACVPNRMPGTRRSYDSRTSLRISRSQRRTSIHSTCAPARGTFWSSTATCAKRAARSAMLDGPSRRRALPLDRIDHDCGGRFRPEIVWFGESLPPAVWREAQRAAARADVILVIGTSAVVYPAAALATHYNDRAFVAEINPEATPISDRVDCARESAQPKYYRGFSPRLDIGLTAPPRPLLSAT